MKLLLCPISMEILKDPYFLQCGHVFEKNYIVTHFKYNNNKCPLCMQVSTNTPKRLYLNAQTYRKFDPLNQDTQLTVILCLSRRHRTKTSSNSVPFNSKTSESFLTVTNSSLDNTTKIGT